jgi:hypothetical protein
MGGSWKRVCHGQGHRIWAPEGNLGDERRGLPLRPTTAPAPYPTLSRRVGADVQLPRSLRLLADRRLAPQTPPRAEHAHPGPPLPPRMGDQRRWDRDVPATSGRDRALPRADHLRSYLTVAAAYHHGPDSHGRCWRRRSLGPGPGPAFVSAGRPRGWRPDRRSRPGPGLSRARTISQEPDPGCSTAG